MSCTTQTAVSHGCGHNTSFIWSVRGKRNNHDVIPVATVCIRLLNGWCVYSNGGN